jgi:hypothetical protein
MKDFLYKILGEKKRDTTKFYELENLVHRSKKTLYGNGN